MRSFTIPGLVSLILTTATASPINREYGESMDRGTVLISYNNGQNDLQATVRLYGTERSQDGSDFIERTDVHRAVVLDAPDNVRCYFKKENVGRGYELIVPNSFGMNKPYEGPVVPDVEMFWCKLSESGLSLAEENARDERLMFAQQRAGTLRGGFPDPNRFHGFDRPFPYDEPYHGPLKYTDPSIFDHVQEKVDEESIKLGQNSFLDPEIRGDDDESFLMNENPAVNPNFKLERDDDNFDENPAFNPEFYT